ncbi:hypothetical protein ABFS82_14G195200 [Erythranthe guttata]|uniref:Uncharacterized protein n=1 Tax=Erythranthe guttata TaxID=4155 RepID=A0A022RCN9_ERYGU|nr:PREDICTED: uncharacterized protein LOC105957232 [Erythranthe guttata]EYU38117.1 hypothetical protein MIMGU_mgv1a013910mg [Erythranthe guttata]|eukprot:XP_012836615.1 PREDICTED: uncharacterized protein LOC105957232 [Erythranthe guttata]
MGNCLFGGMGDGDQSLIRVATSTGGVMEFSAPITVESITDEFPGHGIFRSHDLFWKPLPHSDVLLAGESYHLLPLLDSATVKGAAPRVGHVRSNSAPPQQLGGSAPYRMSFDSRGLTKRSAPAAEDAVHVGGKAAAYGFWKVKLVISPEQLMEILAEEGKTEELIESVRTVAKCGSGFVGGFSDHWSLSSSSRNAASSNKDVLLEI